MSVAKHKSLTPLLVIIAVFAICAGFFLWAKMSNVSNESLSVSPKSVSVQAQIETDGSLSVVDQRTLSLSAEKTTLSWGIEKTTKVSETSVSSVRLIVEGESDTHIMALGQAELTEAQAEELHEDDFKHLPQNCWFFDAEDSWFYASISPEFAGQEVVVEVSYVQANAVYVYDDVAELYWDYLPASNVSPASALADALKLGTRDQGLGISISAQVLIPSSTTNEIIDHKTVWGWGHGFEGEVEFSEAGAYIYNSEAASLTKNSRAHIIFPASCLVNFNKNSQTNVGGARKNFAISEEERWTDEDAVQTANSALVSAWACSIAALITFMAAIAYAGVYRKYKRILSDNVSLKEQLAFDEKSFRTQKKLFILSCTLLLISLVCLISLKSVAGFGAFFLSFITCLIESNWMPSVHSSFRDRIKG